MDKNPNTDVISDARGDVWTPPRLTTPEAIQTCCRMLADAHAVRRIDITLRQSRADDAMDTIRQAREVATEWNLDMYAGFQAGDLRLSFVKRVFHAYEAPTPDNDERKQA